MLKYSKYQLVSMINHEKDKQNYKQEQRDIMLKIQLIEEWRLIILSDRFD